MRSSLSFRSIQWIVMAVFFVSGACGLMHEVVWTRLFRHVMGSSTYAVSMVLTVFMGGLALGGYLGGIFMDRKKPNPLKVLTFLEGGIALSAVLMPWLLQISQPLYKAAYSLTGDSFALVTLLRFLFSAALLIVPTTLMGATLPVITRFFADNFLDTGKAAGKLYAVNTFGAVLGTASAGFLLIPGLGVSATIYLAASFNLIISLSMYVLSKMAVQAEQTPEPAKAAKVARAIKKARQVEPVVYGNTAILVLLIGYGLSGFAALAYEVAWTRVLAMMIGSSVYAFTLILTAFVAGLALGCMFSSWVVNRFRDPLQMLGLLQILIGISALAAVPLLGSLPLYITGYIATYNDSFLMQQVAEFLFVFAIMIIPTMLMGAAFPLATRVFSLKSRSVSKSVGVVYGSNTLGTIFGSFAAGFILIPTIGVQNSILFSVLLNIIAAAGFLLVSPSMRIRLKAPAMAGVFGLMIAVGLFLPSWDMEAMTFGPFYEAIRLSDSMVKSPEKLYEIAKQRKILFHKDGPDASVTVKEFPDNSRALYINGKPDASSHGDLPSQVLVAHLPLMLHPDPKETMVLGLASGVTLGSATLHPIENIDCLEISPSMVQASHYFDEYNNRPLDNPKVNLIIGDGRNHLALSDKLYDVIISEPSNPYFAGLADLFTQDFFQLMKTRLKPDGLACAWVQTYLIDPDSFKSIVASFQSVFPNMTMWKTLKGDCMMVGAIQELNADWSTLAERIQVPEIAEDLQRININDLADFLGHMLMGPSAAAAFAQDGKIHTDDNVIIEFAAPKAVVGHYVFRWPLIEAMEKHRAADFSFITNEKHSAGSEETLQQARDKVAAHGLVYQYYLATQDNSANLNEIGFLQQAAQLDPNNSLLEDALEIFRAQAYSYAKGGNFQEALTMYEGITSVVPGDPKAHYNMATMYRQKENFDKALEHYAIAAKSDPNYYQAHYNLATLYKYEKDYEMARRHYELAIKAKPDFYPSLADYASLIFELPEPSQEDLKRSVELAEKAVALTEEKDITALMTLSEAYARNMRIEDALSVGRRALAIAERTGNPQLMMQVRRLLDRHEQKRS